MLRAFVERVNLMLLGVFCGGAWLITSMGGEVAQAAVGGCLGPSALAVSPDRETLFVACADGRQLVWIDIPRGECSGSLPLPGRPTGLVFHPAGRELYVTCAGPPGVVVVLDAAARRICNTIPVGHTPTAPVVSADGNRLYVCNRYEGGVSVVDLALKEETARVATVREPVAAALTHDGRSLVVANHLPLEPADDFFVRGAVTIVDTTSLETTTVPIADGASSLQGICITPDDRYALVTHVLSNFDLVASHVEEGWMNTNAISFIDLQARKWAGNAILDDRYLGAANPWAIAFSPDAGTLFVTHAGSHELSVIPASPLFDGIQWGYEYRGPIGGINSPMEHRRRIRLPGNGPRALVVDHARVFVAEYFSDTVVVLDSGTDADPTLRTIALGPRREPSLARRGEMLFHDARLCYQQWQTCASCHPDGRADGLNWDLLNDGAGNRKNTKSMLLAHETPPAMARGVRASAEAAVRAGMHHILFGEPDEQAAAAIDCYLKSLRPVPSPFLDSGRLSARAERGRQLFQSPRTGCSRCHPPPLYTDRQMHTLGPRDIDGQRRYDTPSLVEVWRTAPYRHDGHFLTVREMLVEGRHGLTAEQLEGLPQRDIDDLVEFVLSL